MAEMKNICGKIPMDLHEKVREEIELTESSTQKFLQQVIEEHFNRLEGKGEISMGAVRTVAVQVTEDLFSRLKAVLARNGMKQKDFLIGLIEAALEEEEAKWKAESEEAEETEGEPAESEMEDPETAESEPDEESAEPEADEEPTEPENEEPAEAEPTELETEEAEESEPEEAESEE